MRAVIRYVLERLLYLVDGRPIDTDDCPIHGEALHADCDFCFPEAS